MIQQIEEHITKVDAFTASTLDDVEKFRIAYLGKKGVLNDLVKQSKIGVECEIGDFNNLSKAFIK